MKTTKELRSKINQLVAEQRSPGIPQGRRTALYGMEMALRWAAGMDVEYADDLNLPIPLRWRRQEDGTYVAQPGYRIHQQAPNSWYCERPDNQPMGWNVYSTLEMAKKACDNDWQGELSGEMAL